MQPLIDSVQTTAIHGDSYVLRYCQVNKRDVRNKITTIESLVVCLN